LILLEYRPGVLTPQDLDKVEHFIKMGRFDKTFEGFRKDSVLSGKICTDI
jgi:hypothetical protein